MFYKQAILFLIAVAVFVLQSCSHSNEKKIASKEKPVIVSMAISSSTSQSAILSSGQVESAQTANVSTRVMGRITTIFAKIGDHVTRGQVLATVSDEDIKAKRAQTNAQIAEAEASLYSAQKDYDRFNELYKQQSATQKELENVTLQYNSSKSRLEAAKQMRNEVNAMLAYSIITAPFSGVVTQKLTETGSIATPGMPILTIEQTGILQVSVTIAESDISHVKLQDVADILVKSTGKSFKGKIIQINPSSQFTGGQYHVKVSVPDSVKSSLNPGMFVNVTIPLHHATNQTADLILVPSSAIIFRDELTGIYTVSDDHKAMLRWIRTGKTYGDKIEVLSGLSRDERFVLSSVGRLFNGTPVSIK